MKARAAGRPGKAVVSVLAAPASSHPQAEAAYAALVRRFMDQPRVSLPADERGKFGSNALKVDGKIFAMLVKGALAVKLSPAAVEAATTAGRGEPLAMGRRVMKEWLLVREPSRRWYAIAEQARAFVAGERGESPLRTPAARPERAPGRPRAARRKR
jgi:hypothetical protein